MRIAIIAIALVLVMACAYFTYAPFKPAPRFDESVTVWVYPDHFVINGARFGGAIGPQLRKYETTNKHVLILLMGAYDVVNSRVGELGDLQRNPNVHVGLVTARVVE